MKKDVRVYLDDIIESCGRISEYIEGVDRNTFENDEKIQDAVTRRLEIIGEAANRLPKEFMEEHKEIPWQKAISMRNILIHVYDEIDLTIVWETITETLPPFKKQVEELLLKLS